MATTYEKPTRTPKQRALPQMEPSTGKLARWTQKPARYNSKNELIEGPRLEVTLSLPYRPDLLLALGQITVDELHIRAQLEAKEPAQTRLELEEEETP